MIKVDKRIDGLLSNLAKDERVIVILKNEKNTNISVVSGEGKKIIQGDILLMLCMLFTTLLERGFKAENIMHTLNTAMGEVSKKSIDTLTKELEDTLKNEIGKLEKVA